MHAHAGVDLIKRECMGIVEGGGVRVWYTSHRTSHLSNVPLACLLSHVPSL